MASLDSLPADQRAVLQLVLQRGRSYDEIAALLSIDRAAVRQRALAALDALGPHTRVLPERRALIADYLLGQLPPRVAADTRDRLADSPSERAWARVLASELGSIGSGQTPEIPSERERAEPVPAAEEPAAPASAPVAAEPVSEAARAPEREPARERPSRRDAGLASAHAAGRASSRRGGILLLAAAAIVIIVVAIVLIAGSGAGKKPVASTTSPTTSTTATAPTSTTGTSTRPSVVAQINLTSPTATSKAAGIAEVLRQGTKEGIAIVAQNVPANTRHDAYAVWLYNTPTDASLLGFVNPGVGSSGRLSTAGTLPANASHFKNLILTLETQAKPKQPGKIILQGQLTGV